MRPPFMDKHSVSSEIYTSSYYNDRCGGVEFFHAYGADVLKPLMQQAVIAAGLEKGMRLLDVGCGRGELTANLAKKGFDIIGIDYSAEAVDLAQKSFPHAAYQQGRLETLAFQEASFDRIFFLGTIEHLYDDEIKTLIQQFEKLLKKGGAVIITTCTNPLYYKCWTFSARARLSRLVNRFGISLKAPRPPRSEEDESMHVNELRYFRLKRLLGSPHWHVGVRPLPNKKLYVRDIYDTLPPDFPVKPASFWKRILFKSLMRVSPFYLFFGRTHLVVLRFEG